MEARVGTHHLRHKNVFRLKGTMGAKWPPYQWTHNLYLCRHCLKRECEDCTHIQCTKWGRRDCCWYKKCIPPRPLVSEGFHYLRPGVWPWACREESAHQESSLRRKDRRERFLKSPENMHETFRFWIMQGWSQVLDETCKERGWFWVLGIRLDIYGQCSCCVRAWREVTTKWTKKYFKLKEA